MFVTGRSIEGMVNRRTNISNSEETHRRESRSILAFVLEGRGLPDHKERRDGCAIVLRPATPNGAPSIESGVERVRVHCRVVRSLTRAG